MRALILKSIVIAGAAALAGCLVAETPVLDENTGKATPISAGEYRMCSFDADDAEGDCERISIAIDKTGLYTLAKPDDVDDTAQLRFRRIGRRGYAVQAYEDDGAMYYYGRGGRKSISLTLMMCDDLSEKTRAKLIERGDLVSDDGDYGVCEVTSVAGLETAARDYHRGRATPSDEEVSVVITPVETH